MRHTHGDAPAHHALAVLMLASRGLFEVDDAPLLARAQELLTRAIALDPSVASYHSTLAYVYDQRGRLEQALSHFRTARRCVGKPRRP